MRVWILLCLIVTSSLYGEEWVQVKRQTLSKMQGMEGWCTPEKGELIMEVIKKERPSLCVEIGVYGGKSLLPIAKTLKYNKLGKVFGIDAWDPQSAAEGWEKSDPNFEWWRKQDFAALQKKVGQLIAQEGLAGHVTLQKEKSQKAVTQFADESIDFLHFDGNHAESVAWEDVKAYFPKVREGGIILFNDATWSTLQGCVVFLLERCELLTPFHEEAGYLLFKKSKKRIAKAQELMHD